MSSRPSPEAARAKEIFLDVLEQRPEKRAPFLAEACGKGEEGGRLRERVEKLLEAHSESSGLEGLVEGLRPATLDHGKAPIQLGEYEILEELGRGANGTVYRARQARLDRQVALKVLRAGHLATEDDVRRFQREAEAAAALDHPGIVPIFDVGTSDGYHFFTMKCVEGAGLDRIVERFSDRPRSAARLVSDVARAVQHAHDRGVLHRDLKPSNILVGEDGIPHVVDLGIARPLGRPAITRTGLISGTPAYMSPEQARGARDVTVGSDVWSLGCVLHQLLSGKPPFDGETLVEVLRRVQEDPPAPLVGVDRDLATVVATCLAKEPERRYPSARALAEDLGRWLAHQPILARPTTRLERLRLFCRRSPVAAALALGVIVLLLVVAVGGTGMSVVLTRQLAETSAANRRASERLRTSLLANARAERLSAQAGRREAGLALLRQAAELAPGSDVRDEAISALTLTDLATELSWSLPERFAPVGVDDDLEHVALRGPGGAVEVRDVRGAPRFVLPHGRLPARQALFTHGGRRLWLRRHGSLSETEGVLEVWDLEETGPRRAYHREVLASHLARSEDGTQLALVAAGTDQVELLDVEDFKVVGRLEVAHAHGQSSFRPGGKALAVATGIEGQVVVLGLPGGRPLAKLELTGRPNCVDWSPDGGLLMVGTLDQRAHVWETDTWSRVATLRGHEAEIMGVALLGNGRALSHSWDGTTRLWDLGQATEILRESALFLDVDRSGRRVLLTDNRRIVLASLVGDEVLRVLRAHEGKAPAEVNASPDGRQLVTCGDDTWMLWSHQGAPLARIETGHVSSAFFDPLSGDVVSSGEAGLLRWSVGQALQGEPVPEVLLPDACRRSGCSDDGRYIGVVRGNQALLVNRAGEVRVLGDHHGLDRVALPPDGRWMAVGSWGGSGLRVWDTATGELLAHHAPESTAAMATFSPDGRHMVLATFGEIRILRTDTWTLEHTVERLGPSTPPVPAAFSPDGKTLAVPLTGGRVRLLGVGHWEPLANLEPARPRQLFHLTFLGDARLAVASPSHRLLLWDLEALSRELVRRHLDFESVPLDSRER